MSNNCVNIRKTGLFYSVFDNDAAIIHYLLHYKIVDGRVGFPTNAIDKVINTLEDKKINYQILGSSEFNDFKNLNTYSEYLSKSINKMAVQDRIDNILKELDNKNEEELLKIIEGMERLVYE